MNSTHPNWFSIAGLALSLLGAVVLAWGLFLSDEDAIKLGSSYWSGGTQEDKLKLPPVADRLRQSRNAKIGIVLIALGTVLQIVGACFGVKAAA